MLGWYAGSLKPHVRQAVLKFYASVATILVFVPLIFITGSRAGLLLMMPALVLALCLIYFGGYYPGKTARKRRPSSSKFSLPSGRRLMLVIGIITISGMAIASVLLSRSLAFDRLFSGGDVEELRWQLLPTLVTMLKDYMPWGSGFGSFEHVYKIYETPELLRPSYLNQAHNDWLQFFIEGGVPALLIAICAIVWFCVRLGTVAKTWRSSNPVKYGVLMCLAAILFLLAASIGDYPLRVPIIMAIFAVLVCVFNDGINSVQRRDSNQP
ncbi:O-antigen ligase family protein [Parasphingorhabdus flavimaris]|nr:O-antigen ligase family protein [Parasphingorhabdus flavimaris]